MCAKKPTQRTPPTAAVQRPHSPTAAAYHTFPRHTPDGVHKPRAWPTRWRSGLPSAAPPVPSTEGKEETSQDVASTIGTAGRVQTTTALSRSYQGLSIVSWWLAPLRDTGPWAW